MFLCIVIRETLNFKHASLIVAFLLITYRAATLPSQNFTVCVFHAVTLCELSALVVNGLFGFDAKE
jgi:hypothetical protein